VFERYYYILLYYSVYWIFSYKYLDFIAENWNFTGFSENAWNFSDSINQYQNRWNWDLRRNTVHSVLSMIEYLKNHEFSATKFQFSAIKSNLAVILNFFSSLIKELFDFIFIIELFIRLNFDHFDAFEKDLKITWFESCIWLKIRIIFQNDFKLIKFYMYHDVFGNIYVTVLIWLFYKIQLGCLLCSFTRY
jgi:hypothetical protein